MMTTSSSIAQIDTLVERLAELWRRCLEDSAIRPPSPADPLDTASGHGSRQQALVELWPGLSWGEGPPLDDQALARVEASARERAGQAAQELGRRKDRLRQDISQLRQDTRQAAGRQQALVQASADTLPPVRRLQKDCAQTGADMQRHREQAQGLAGWLSQVAPQGLKRFRHPANPRSFDQEFLSEANSRLRAQWERVRQDQERLAGLQEALEAACARRDQATQALEQGRLELARFQEEREQGLARLRVQNQEIERAAQRMSQAEAHLTATQATRKLYQRLLTQAGAVLRPFLAASPPSSRPLRNLEEALALAQAQGRRAERLADLARKAESALERLAQKAAPLGNRAREINRELDRQEKELPALVAPLTGSQGAQDEVMTLVAGRLSLLLPRLEELGPGLAQTHSELEGLKEAMALNLERGKAFTEAWRSAAKAERSARDAVAALAMESQSLARERREQAKAMVQAATPLAQVMSRLPLADLVPGLAAVARRTQAQLDQALALDGQAASALERLGQSRVKSLAQTPASWKSHAALLRRMAVRKLEPRRLAALLHSARLWQEQLGQARVRAIRAPAQEVATRLAKSLSLAVGQESRLRAARTRSAMRLAGLRRDLGQQGRELAATIRDLAQARDSGQSQALRIRDLDAQLLASRATGEQTKAQAVRLLGELAATQSSLARALELGRRQDSRIEDLDARLQTSRQEGSQAKREIRDLAAQAEGLRRELGMSQEQLAQARSEHARQSRQVTRLESDLADARALHLAHGEAARERIAALDRELADERQVVALSRMRLRQAAQRQARQSLSLRETEAQLSLARQGQAAAGQLVRRLEDLGLDHQYLEERLGQSMRLAQALQLKALERHRLLRQAQAALAPLEHWREEALRLQQEHRRLRQELNETKAQLKSAEQRLAAARVAKDQATARLASEQTARAQQALDLLEGQTLAVELAAAQGEAERWAGLCQSLSQAMVVMGSARPPEIRDLQGQVGALTAECDSLRQELANMAILAAMAQGGQPPARPSPVGVRLTFAGPGENEAVLRRMAGLRARLKDLGRHTLGHWGLVAALTAGLSLLAPQTPSKATLQDSPQLPTRQEVRHISQNLSLGQAITVPVQVGLAAQGPAAAELEINLLPLRAKSGPLPGHVQRQIEAVAKAAGLKPAVLMTSARAVLGDQEVVDSSVLSDLAGTARNLAKRHPLIFRELSAEGLPKNAQELASQPPSAEQGQHLYQDRLYREYRALGFPAEEALGALAANERAARKMRGSWHIPSRYKGQVTPVASVESMGLTEFMARVTPYIQSRVDYFLRHQGGTFTGDTAAYSSNLAYDIYCAAKKFDVPVSLMLVIANQETSYANVLGDSNRSASPFQIFEPTRRLIVTSLERRGFVPPPKEIPLQHHLTVATFLAAFHVRELIQESTVSGQGQLAYVDTDRVMKRYNGSSVYAGQVALRQRQLTSFLGLTPG